MPEKDEVEELRSDAPRWMRATTAILVLALVAVTGFFSGVRYADQNPPGPACPACERDSDGDGVTDGDDPSPFNPEWAYSYRLVALDLIAGQKWSFPQPLPSFVEDIRFESDADVRISALYRTPGCDPVGDQFEVTLESGTGVIPYKMSGVCSGASATYYVSSVGAIDGPTHLELEAWW